MAYFTISQYYVGAEPTYFTMQLNY